MAQSAQLVSMARRVSRAWTAQLVPLARLAWMAQLVQLA
jgi:hypothetical protein